MGVVLVLWAGTATHVGVINRFTTTAYPARDPARRTVGRWSVVCTFAVFVVSLLYAYHHALRGLAYPWNLG